MKNLFSFQKYEQQMEFCFMIILRFVYCSVQAYKKVMSTQKLNSSYFFNLLWQLCSEYKFWVY